MEKSAKDQAAAIKKERQGSGEGDKADGAAAADAIKKAGDQAADARENKADAAASAAKTRPRKRRRASALSLPPWKPRQTTRDPPRLRKEPGFFDC